MEDEPDDPERRCALQSAGSGAKPLAMVGRAEGWGTLWSPSVRARLRRGTVETPSTCCKICKIEIRRFQESPIGGIGEICGSLPCLSWLPDCSRASRSSAGRNETGCHAPRLCVGVRSRLTFEDRPTPCGGIRERTQRGDGG